jgi:hypothetical protein
VALRIQPPEFRAAAELAVRSERVEPEQALREYAAELSDPGAVARYVGAPDSARAWGDALAAERLLVNPKPETGSIELSGRGADAAQLAGLLSEVTSAFALCAADVERQSLALEEWRQEAGAVAAELRDAERQAAAQRAAVGDTPELAAWEQARDALARIEREARAIEADLAQRREARAALEAQELPRGAVTPETIQKALAGDPVYQEDLKEYRSAASAYQHRLAIALVLTADPMPALRTTLMGFRSALVEQRELNPPPACRALLEECVADVDEFDLALTEFMRSWQARSESVQRCVPEDSAPEMLDAHTQAIESAARLLTDARALHGRLTSRLDRVAEPGGTRETVIAAMLRGELGPLAERVAELEKGAASLQLASNVELDANDRLLRSLKVRIGERRQGLLDAVQRQADELAGALQTEQLRDADAQTQALEAQRDALLAQMAPALARQREMEQGAVETREQLTRLRSAEERVAQLGERLAEIEAARPSTPPDELELLSLSLAQTAGGSRIRDAQLAAAGAFAGAWLVGALLFLPTPQRRRSGVE